MTHQHMRCQPIICHLARKRYGFASLLHIQSPTRFTCNWSECSLVSQLHDIIATSATYNSKLQTNKHRYRFKMKMMTSSRSKRQQQNSLSVLVVVAVAVVLFPLFATAWSPLQRTQRLKHTEPSRQLLFTTPAFTTTGLAMTSDADNAEPSPADDEANNPLQEALNEEEVIPQQQQRAPSPPRPPQPRRLDPLIASLTRMDDSARNVPTVKAPIFGEVPLDGSLVVLVPTTLIAVAGFVLSIYIAFNSPDAIVDSLNDLNKEIITAASSGPPQILPPDANGCRGLCSSQDQDLEGLRIFMNKLAGK